MKAYCLIRPQPWYRREAFLTGMRAAGLDVQNGPPQQINRGDVVLMWNRYSDNHGLANRIEADGGIVLVAENGYLGQGGTTPKFDVHGGVEPGHYYALAVSGHNGSGRWLHGDGARFAQLGVTLQPWRTGGDYILICPSRNFGRPDMLMPSLWVQNVTKAIRAFSKCPIRVREHPGNSRPQRELAEDLAGAAAVVVWASTAGVHALVAGIPVAAYAPHWICKGAAFEAVSELLTIEQQPDVRERYTTRRQAAFERLAWAQWTVDEIASGAPFDHLLRHAGQG